MMRAGYFRVGTVLVVMMIAALIAVMAGYGSASAQSTAAFPGSVITVNTKVDGFATDGDCSLSEAILAANNNARVDRCKAGSATERDAIRFDLGTKKAKTIVLRGRQLITDPSGLRINGQDSSITISGNEQLRVFEVVAGAQLALSNLTVADGFASGTDSGGGLWNNGGTVKVANTTFSNNSTTNVGGGILNHNGGTLTVTNSTFSENSARYGGGIDNNDSGSVTVTNSTFSENSATQGAGGILINFGPVTLRNTIVANSTSGGNCGGLVGGITDDGYNIDDDGSCVDASVTTSRTTDPLLADQPANNSGPTKTIKLLPGSPAVSVIPEGENGCGTEITRDQRGVKRPQGPGCDIGAFEKKRNVQPNQEETA